MATESSAAQYAGYAPAWALLTFLPAHQVALGSLLNRIAAGPWPRQIVITVSSFLVTLFPLWIAFLPDRERLPAVFDRLAHWNRRMIAVRWSEATSARRRWPFPPSES